MKKVLSLFLALCTSLSIPTFSFSEEIKDVVEGDAYIYAEKLLSDLGVYEGVEAFSAADGFVKKDVFAIIITRLMKKKVGTDIGNSVGLLDVKPGDFAANEIFMLMNLGVLDIPADGYFRPGNFITYKEAAKALVQVLGYDIVVTDKTFDGYLSQAQDIGILKNVPFSKDERLQVKQLTLMLYNSLFVDSMVMTFTGTGWNYSISEGDTLLLNNFNLIEISGVITANSITNLDFSRELPAGKVIIDNVTYDVGKTNAEELLGYKVRGYYDKDTDTLISVDYTRYTEELRLNLEDLEYKNQEYTYYVNNSRKTAKISSKADIIYNYEAMVYDKSLMVPHEGEVLLLDHDSDGEYDTVVITSTETRVVQEYAKPQNEIAFKYSAKSIDFDKYDENRIIVLKADGTPGKLTSLVEWSVLTICQSPSGKYIEITITNDKVTGDVKSVDNSDGKNTVTINDKKYEISYYYPNKDKDKISLGLTGTFYLDKYGKMAAFNLQENIWYYGYLMKTGFVITNTDDTYMFRIFSEESGGSVKQFQASEKVRIDNTLCDRVGKDKEGNDIVAKNLAKPQLIRYKANSRAEITHIDTIDTPKNEIGLRIDADKANRKYRGNQFLGDINIDSATKVFVIPSDEQISYGELYTLKNASYFANDGYYTITSYIIDSDSLISDAIVCVRSTGASFNSAVMIEEINTVYDEEREEVIDKFIGRMGSTSYEYIASAGTAEQNGIKKGDLVSFGVAPNGIVEAVDKIYDCTGGGTVTTKYASYATANFDAGYKILVGYAYNKQSGIVQISSDSSSLSGAKKVPIGSASVVIYDKTNSKNPVSVGTIKEVRDFKHYSKADKVICLLNYQALRTVFVYKN